jgi:propionyl-CoA carboxylase alpha chain
MNRRPITRLLIANRGEIAVRIARTADRLGIDTVAVYSEPDADSLHVRSMDLAVALGGSTPADSYLRGERIVRAALDTGCDAVHPGYGFLAENAEFATRVIEAGLVWVGPGPEQIALLGDKVAAKKAAVAAGVPTTSVIEITGTEVPDDVAFPSLVKAAAGGGGRGMRVVHTSDELAGAIEAASREALSAFGDGTVFIEPYLERGRHIEVQVVGDSHGNVIHLGERECSIQRRNQKVLEETPSVGISSETRAALCDGAVALARHVGYENAGTVEFLVGDDGTVNFLEVNTRLQVEHPVTEAVTGVDLVELQLRVAAGEQLPLAQDEVVFSGHAIEARVVAEDPAHGWLPSTGRIGSFDIAPHVRVDTGIGAGSAISPDYDSLVAKVIAHAPTRGEASQRLAKALRTARVTGVGTNLAMLAEMLGEADFLAGSTFTSYLADHPQVLDPPGPQGDDRLALLLGAVFSMEYRDRSANAATGFAPSGWRNLRTRGQRQVWLQRGGENHVEYVLETESTARVWVGPWPEPLEDGSLPEDERRVAQVRLVRRSHDEQVMEIDGVQRAVDVIVAGDTVHTRSPAGTASWRLAPRFVIHEVDEASSGPISPLPGTVIAVHVAEGDAVAEGELLMVVEAMKMEHKITAGSPAKVHDVRFGVGDRVDAGDLLVELHHDE